MTIARLQELVEKYQAEERAREAAGGGMRAHLDEYLALDELEALRLFGLALNLPRGTKSSCAPGALVNRSQNPATLGRYTRWDHQRRIRKEVLERVKNLFLEHAEELLGQPSFDALYERIAAFGVRGYGAISIYDAAHHIGWLRGVVPELVYLHRGAFVGARRLLPNLRKTRLDASDLPAPLRMLEPMHCENFLCNYADKLSPIE